MPEHLHGIPTLAGDNEPVFTLRAKDVCSSRAVRYWADEAERLGADAAHIQCVRRWADRMDYWRAAHGGAVPHSPMNPVYRAACRGDGGAPDA